MNWEAITAIGETVGALAVVASLIYVATQIRLANRISVREARAELIEAISQIYRLPLEHPQIAQLEVKLQSKNPTLTPEEKHQVRALVNLWIPFTSKVSGAHESGLLPDRVFEIYMDTILQQIASQPGLIPHFVMALKESPIERGDFAALDRIFDFLATHE